MLQGGVRTVWIAGSWHDLRRPQRVVSTLGVTAGFKWLRRIGMPDAKCFPLAPYQRRVRKGQWVLMGEDGYFRRWRVPRKGRKGLGR